VEVVKSAIALEKGQLEEVPESLLILLMGSLIWSDKTIGEV
jgi:hypothetical protein